MFWHWDYSEYKQCNSFTESNAAESKRHKPESEEQKRNSNLRFVVSILCFQKPTQTVVLHHHLRLKANFLRDFSPYIKIIKTQGYYLSWYKMANRKPRVPSFLLELIACNRHKPRCNEMLKQVWIQFLLLIEQKLKGERYQLIDILTKFISGKEDDFQLSSKRFGDREVA